MEKTVIIYGKCSLKEDFVNLILLSAPYFKKFFGKNVEFMFKKMFCLKNNLFSFENTFFIEIDGKIAGMILGYNGKMKFKKDLYTGLLMIKFLKFDFFKNLKGFLKFNKIVGKLKTNQFYISNIAVYPEFRKRGFGKLLMIEIEKSIKQSSVEEKLMKKNKYSKNKIKSIILDVEKENTKAIRFYKNLGYKIKDEFNIKIKSSMEINLYRMGKDI